MPKIALDDFIKEMNDLESALKDTEPLMAHIANTLALFTSQSFEKETSPFGESGSPYHLLHLKRARA